MKKRLIIQCFITLNIEKKIPSSQLEMPFWGMAAEIEKMDHLGFDQGSVRNKSSKMFFYAILYSV